MSLSVAVSVRPMALLFSFIAGALFGVAAGRVALPLWRNAAAFARGSSPYVRAAAFVAIFGVAAGIVYFTIGSHHSVERPGMRTALSTGAAATAGAAGTAMSMDAAVAGLEARLAREGGTTADWTLLAQAYDFLGRADDAKRARAKAGISASGPANAVTAGPVTAPAAASTEVSGTVNLDARFANRVQPDATLFIYAKAADSPGPPLAVLRAAVGSWPVSFRLDDSMAMIPSRRLSQFDRVVIEARISRSGQATPAAGDLYVTSQVLRPAAGARLTLVINREIG
jgi:hypothetical protein